MDSSELPECPVCLQSYNGDETLPRVLPCGHTACESCLKSLPERYHLTVRCPACTQLVKFPSSLGPSSLPKNIDLLRMIPETDNRSESGSKELRNGVRLEGSSFLPRLWSDEFYTNWRKWILPHDAVSVDDVKVRLFKVGDWGKKEEEEESVLKLSYVAKVMNCLYEMSEEKRRELDLILKIGEKRRSSRVCGVNGLWGDLDDRGALYCVCDRLNECSWDDNGKSGFSMVGMEMCEGVMSLHLEGVIAGGLGLGCFEMDDFGHVNLSLNQVLALGRASWSVGDREEMGTMVGELVRREVYLSPEALLEIVMNGDSVSSVGYRSDVWSLGCVLVRLLVGEQFTEDMIGCVDHFIQETSENDGLDFEGLCMRLMEKASQLLESKYGEELQPLQGLLCECLNFQIEKRPSVIDLWKCIREMIVGVKFDTSPRLNKLVIDDGARGKCLVLGEMCQVMKRKSEMGEKDTLPEEEVDVEGANADESQEIEGLVEGKVKFKYLQGHLDCVTGFAIGGGYLYSSSFDKSVCVWSLQDFSHVHTFKGHEHKVMAVIYTEEGLEPSCISADNGGGIFLWSVRNPLEQEPSRKWYEQKDWKYSGIHALTTAGNGYLYTGSGDRLIKAWSLQDGTLSCTMAGHKSVVSTLSACDGVLYSGSWDGTVRLWSLSDHSLLTVLGEGMPGGTLTSVLSVIAEKNIVVASHENGNLKVWKNDQFMKTTEIHKGAIFASSLEGGRLFTGGWDKTVHVQEISGDELQVDIRLIGSIPSSSVITALLYFQGKLFVGHGDRTIKVFSYAK
ncbi:E3 ubiquitin-protein ligase TRAF7 [Linum perenne]